MTTEGKDMRGIQDELCADNHWGCVRGGFLHFFTFKNVEKCS